MASEYWPGFVDHKTGVGRDRDGMWFVALPVTETAPGIFETVLAPGWYPGMPAGWKVLDLCFIDGRPRYFCESPEGQIGAHCMRRTCAKKNTTPGWCLKSVERWRPNAVTCTMHRTGENTCLRGRRRVDYLYAGDPIENPGIEIVGFLSGMPGGDTYFVRLPNGSIRSACLRYRNLAKHNGLRCLRPAGAYAGRKTGACAMHGGNSIGATETRLMNVLDPEQATLLRDVVRPAIINPAAQQLKQRVDHLRYAWYLLVSAIIDRRTWIAKRVGVSEAVDRSTGIDLILRTARNIIDGTKLHTAIQTAQVRDTAKIWASQAYSMRLAHLLVEITIREGGQEVGRQVAQEIERQMLRRGLIAEDTSSLFASAPDAQTATTSEPGAADWALVPSAQWYKPASVEEASLIDAMTTTAKQEAYVFITTQLGDTMVSLYPLMSMLESLVIEEEAADAPLTVRSNLLKAIHAAQKAQLEINRALDVTFTAREEEWIGKEIAGAISEAMIDVDPTLALAIMAEFRIRKNDVELPNRGHEERMGAKMIEVANAPSGRKAKGVVVTPVTGH